MSFTNYILEISSNKILLIISLLTLGVILVNGWTDAPNAIATCISTRVIKPKKAIYMSAFFNFLGIIIMTSINSKVAQTIYNIADFGQNSKYALIAISTALIAIILWSTLAWYYSIPTSESHGLIAGITGSAIAINNSLNGINLNQWLKVIYGLISSTFLGFAIGYVTIFCISYLFKPISLKKTSIFFKYSQIFSAAAMSFLHGAQDGQKFIAIFLLGISLSSNQTETLVFTIPIWLMVLASITMAFGTGIGGLRIIKAVGLDMVKLNKPQGFSADLAAILCLLSSSILGIPVSTTHTKTSAIIGVGFFKNPKKINWKIAKEMIYAWILTFPCCGILAFIITKTVLYLIK